MTTESNDSVKVTKTAGARKRPKVNLAVAKVADGQGSIEPIATGSTPKYTSVYEIMGIIDHSYKTTSLAVYSETLRDMNLYKLHEEAYNRGVPGTDNRETMIDRLERKFIQETTKFADRSGRVNGDHKPDTEKEVSLHDQAMKILARGR